MSESLSAPGQDTEASSLTPGARSSNLQGRPTPDTREDQLLPAEEAVPTAEDPAAVRALALDAIQERYGAMYLYGVSAKRRDAEDSGHALELLSLYTPLNTTIQVPDERPPREERGTLGLAVRRTRSLSLLEVVSGERRAIIRGVRGSGKSTFLRFLALSMAERSSEGEYTGLARLEPMWTLGCMLPLLIDLREYAASRYVDQGVRGLYTHVAAGLGVDASWLRDQLIYPGGVLFLLDNLEAAPEAAAGLVADCGESANCFLITSPNYVDLAAETFRPLEGFAEISLAPWSLEQMDDFVHRWYAEFERQGWVDEEAARDLSGQLRTALRREDVSSLASQPVLMMFITLLHLSQGRLPANRLDLYRELVSLVFTYWSEGRTEDERDLRQVFDLEGLRAAISRVTYQGYGRLERATDRVELDASDLRATLTSVCRSGRWEAAADMVARLATRPGLLDECRPGVYTFAHPSLQSYVAARHLSEQADLPRLIVHLLEEDFARWREVVMFSILRLAGLEQDLGQVTGLFDALCSRPVPASEEATSPAEWQRAWLAGDVLAEVMEQFDVTPLSATLDRVKGWLVALLQRGMLDPSERSQAGAVLDRLPDGDPRPGVAVSDLLWCSVPEGAFWLGEGEQAQSLDLGSFWITRYLVTSAQYEAFVYATGHPAPRYWRGGRPWEGAGNHPVVQVTWQDAARYCEWATQRLRDGSLKVWHHERSASPEPFPASWVVRLPASAEWEKAARGGLLIPSESGGWVDNPLPRRVYPWGDSWRLSAAGIKGDETRCNVAESRIGTTTPVGMYPDGASPYGVLDMAGNVWEWCLDWADETQRYRIRRGGAYRYSYDHSRCAEYEKTHPSLAWPYQGFRVVLGPPVEPG